MERGGGALAQERPGGGHAIEFDRHDPDQPVSLNPNQNLDVNIALNPYTNHSLLLSIIDATSSAVASASAILKDGASFEASNSSGLAGDPDQGQAFFNNLSSTNYDYTISHANYQDASGTVTVNGYTTDTVIMNP